MIDARQAILDRIRGGLRKALLPDAEDTAPAIVLPGNSGGVERFASELEKLSGMVLREDTLQSACERVAALLRQRGMHQALAWESLVERVPTLRQALGEAGIEIVTQGSLEDLAQVPLGITSAQAAIADSGTLVLQNTPGQPAFVSLLPPVHVALLRAGDIHPNLQEYLDSLPDLKGQVMASNNLVFITGPSRTADIELTITLGVHGPGEVIVVIWEKE